jgi:hypothetical protein
MFRRVYAPLLLLVGLIAGSARAQTVERIWSGGGTTNNWSEGANWVGGVAPDSDDRLVFNNVGFAARPSPFNDFPDGSSFLSIVISGGTGYTLNGNRVNVSITANLLTTVNMALEGSRTLQVISGGQLVLTANNSLFTGAIAVREGSLVGLNSNNVFGSGTITLGDAATPADAGSVFVGSNLTIANPIVLAAGTGGRTVGTTNNVTATFSGGVTGSGDLTLNNTGAAANTLTMSGATLNNTGRITATGSQPVTISAPIGSNVTHITSSGGDLTVSGAVTVNSAGTTITKTTSASLTVSGAVSGTGNLVTTNSTTSHAFLVSGTVNNVGTVTNTGSTGGNVSIPDIGSNVTRVVQNGAFTALRLLAGTYGALDVLAGGVSPEGATAFGSGTVTLGNTSGNSRAEINTQFNAVTIANPIVLATGTTGRLIITAGLGSLTLTGGVTGTNNLEVEALAGRTLTFSGGAVNNAGSVSRTNGSATGSATIATIGSNVTSVAQGGGGTFDVTTVLVGAGGKSLTNNNSSGTGLAITTIDGSGAVTFNANGTLAQGVVVSGQIEHTGSITIAGTSSGGVHLTGSIASNVTSLTHQSATAQLTVTASNAMAGAFTLSNGATANVASSSSLGNGGATNTLAMTGTLIATGTISSPSARPVTLTGAATFNTNGNPITIDGSLSGAGSLTKTGAGTLTFNGSSSIGGGITASAGTLTLPSLTTFTLGGSLTNNASITTTGGTVALNGGSAQTIGGSSTTTFNHLTINGAGVTIATSPVVDGTLTLTSGLITTGANKITVVAAGSIAGGSASSYVRGNLERGVPNAATPALAFPVGDASAYAPVSVAFSGTTAGSGNLTASTTAGDHPDIANSGLDATKTANRYWTLTNSGVAGFTSYASTFNFVAGDVDGGATPGSFLVRKNSGGTWSAPTTGTLTATSAQATGLTSFSDFVVGQPLIAAASISSTTPATLTEPALNGATVVVDLSVGSYAGSLAPGNFALTSAPAGTSIASVVRNSATRATLTLAHPGTDFDVNGTLAVQVLQAALALGLGPATTAPVTVNAVLETAVSIQFTTPAALTEPALNGAAIVVALVDGTFAAALAPGDFALAAAPAGASIVAASRTSATTATLTLAFAGDFDADASLSVRVEASALATGLGPVTTGTISVTATVETGATIAATLPASLTELTLAAATLTVDLSAGTYAAALVPANFVINGPAGTSVQGVTRVSGVRATLTLAFGGADFDDPTPLSVTILPAAFAAGAAATTPNVVVQPAPAIVAELRGPESVLSRELSGVITLEFRESNGSLMFTDVPRVFALASSAGASGKFFATADGTTEIMSITLDANARADFYYRDALPGAREIRASTDGFETARLAIRVIRTLTLAFGALPDSVPTDLPISPAITVRAVNRQGLVDATFAGEVMLVVKQRPAGSTLTDTLRAAAVGGVATFPAARLDVAGPGYLFEASVASGEPPPVLSSPIRAYLAPVSVGATMSVSKPNPLEGDTVTVTLTVTNGTGARALGVVYDVPIPDRMEFVRAAATIGTFDRATSTWTIATFEKHQSASLTLTLIVKAQP